MKPTDAYAHQSPIDARRQQVSLQRRFVANYKRLDRMHLRQLRPKAVEFLQPGYALRKLGVQVVSIGRIVRGDEHRLTAGDAGQQRKSAQAHIARRNTQSTVLLKRRRSLFRIRGAIQTQLAILRSAQFDSG